MGALNSADFRRLQNLRVHGQRCRQEVAPVHAVLPTRLHPALAPVGLLAVLLLHYLGFPLSWWLEWSVRLLPLTLSGFATWGDFARTDAQLRYGPFGAAERAEECGGDCASEVQCGSSGGVVGGVHTGGTRRADDGYCGRPVMPMSTEWDSGRRSRADDLTGTKGCGAGTDQC